MRKAHFWILGLVLVLMAIPFATGTVAASGSDQPTAIMATSSVDNHTAVVMTDQTPANIPDAGQFAENNIPKITDTDGNHSYAGQAESAPALVQGAQNRSNAPTDATLVSSSSYTETRLSFSGNENPLASTSASQEAQGRANAQINTTTNTAIYDAADNRNDETAVMTAKTLENSENPMSTTVITRDDFAAKAEQNTDVANIANGRNVGTMTQIALTTNAAGQGRYHVIKPNINGMTRA